MYRIVIYGIKLEDIQPILEEQTGQGGFQTLLRKMKDQYSEQREEFYLDREDIERLYRCLLYTSYFNVVGLPLHQLFLLLSRMDIKPWSQWR